MGDRNLQQIASHIPITGKIQSAAGVDFSQTNIFSFK